MTCVICGEELRDGFDKVSNSSSHFTCWCYGITSTGMGDAFAHVLSGGATDVYFQSKRRKERFDKDNVEKKIFHLLEDKGDPFRKYYKLANMLEDDGILQVIARDFDLEYWARFVLEDTDTGVEVLKDNIDGAECGYLYTKRFKPVSDDSLDLFSENFEPYADYDRDDEERLARLQCDLVVWLHNRMWELSDDKSMYKKLCQLTGFDLVKHYMRFNIDSAEDVDKYDPEKVWKEKKDYYFIDESFFKAVKLILHKILLIGMQQGNWRLILNWLKDRSSDAPFEELQKADKEKLDDLQLYLEDLRSELEDSEQIIMCPRCNFGPIIKKDCPDMKNHHGQGEHFTDNRCQNCTFFANSVTGYYETVENEEQWKLWDGFPRRNVNDVFPTKSLTKDSFVQFIQPPKPPCFPFDEKDRDSCADVDREQLIKRVMKHVMKRG